MLVYKTEVMRHNPILNESEVVAEFYLDELGEAVNAAEGVVETDDVVCISTALECLDGYTETDEPLIMCYKIDTVPKYLKYAY